MVAVPKVILFVVTASLVTGGALVLALHGAPGPGGGADYGLDTDGDGRFDWLVVRMDLKVDAANYYNVWATLGTRTPYGGSCSNGGVPPLPAQDDGYIRDPTTVWPDPKSPDIEDFVYPISWASVREFFEPGEHTVALAFKGTDIGLAGVNGPYVVQAQIFADGDMNWRMQPGIYPPEMQGWTWEYTTGPYRAAEFEEPRWAIRFDGTVADRGEDADSDGLFDFLVVTADVQVNLAGTYAFDGTLTFGSDAEPWYWVTGTWGTVDLAEGTQQLEVRFNGGDIWASGHSGTFDFMLGVYFGGGWIVGEPNDGTIREGEPYPEGDFDVYGDSLCGTTSEYRHEQWEERVEPAEFTGAFDDRGEDTDSDGLFDYLVVDAEVNVVEANLFDFSGQLMSEDGTVWIAGDYQQAYLEVGVQTLTLRFPGGAIHVSGIDGPYRVDMNLVVAMRDPTATYTTKAYAHTDFDPDGQTGTRSHWISDLSADSSTIAVMVTRGNDVLDVVIQDVLYVQAFAADGTLAFEGKDSVYLPSGGMSQSFTFSWSPSPGEYVVVAILGDPSQPTDAVRIVVTV